MAKRAFIPIPPPAPLPTPEKLSAEDLAPMIRGGQIDILCIMGPTASGKTAYAVRLARELRAILCGASVESDGGESSGSNNGAEARRTGVEILSADSRQIYRGMDIGTGKDLAEYGDVPYHLIDIADPGERYSICRYQRDFAAAYADCLSRGVFPILCGGSGLYVEAVTKAEYEMEENAPLGLTLPQKPFYVATLVDRETRRARIDRRLDERLEDGMVEEIRGLMASVPAETLIRYGLEYKFVTQYLLGEFSYDFMREHLAYAIHQFAKRQMTWLRGMEKDGVCIHWVEP